MSTSDWPLWSSGERPSVREDAVHIWRLSLEHSPTRVGQMAELCSPDERLRGDRFRFDRDRRRFLVGRSSLRTILSLYCGGKPQDLRFIYGQYGKPSLAQGAGLANVQFNVSHSHELFLCAVAPRFNLGIDVEYLRPLPDAEQIAERFFAPEEYEEWQSLPHAEKADSFYACWTRKEAFLKATEEGLMRPLDSFAVTVPAREPARLLHSGGDEEVARRYSMFDVHPAENYRSALVVEGSPRRVDCFTWPA